MKRHKLQWEAAGRVTGLLAFLAAGAPADAQTWHWQYVTRMPNTAPLAARSTVAVAAGELRMTYTVPLQHRQVVIEACHASLSDVQSASTVHTQGRTYLLVQLKPAHAASCVSGKRPAVALPTDDERFVSAIAGAINRSCCVAPRVIANASPAPPKPSPAPPMGTPQPVALTSPAAHSIASPAASPSPHSPAVPATADWVESDGVFAFVRVRNATRAALRIRGIEVFDCRDVSLGCGPSSREYALDAYGIVTIATVASADQRRIPTFRYRYRALAGNREAASSGDSGTRKPRRIARMSAQDIRSAQAGALDGLRSPAPQPATPILPARLVKRGSSQLAVGQTGTAIVRLVIAENGTPQEATIVSITNRRLAAAAIETAVSSTYVPATQNGKPLAAKYIATFSFNGEDPATASIPIWKRSPLPATPSPAATAASAPAQPAVSPLPRP